MSFKIVEAGPEERQHIYRMRHDIFAIELGQHSVNNEGKLTDALDEHNIYLVLYSGTTVAGFVSITPPASPRFSIDKYFDRESLPFDLDESTFEVRLLSVLPGFRNSSAAIKLMHGSLKYVQAHGGRRIVAIGRQEILRLYERCGLTSCNLSARSGAVNYQLMIGETSVMATRATELHNVIGRERPLEQHCYHGGAFYEAVGDRFDDLSRRNEVINSDTLDAWFSPSPNAIKALRDNLAWIMRTSPPTHANGLEAVIAESRNVDASAVLAGAGSSDLMFLAIPKLLAKKPRVGMIDPMYGEYRHIIEHLCDARIELLHLDAEMEFRVDIDQLDVLASSCDILFLVNPNSPTGQHVDAETLRKLICLHPDTHFWVDETYVDYAGSNQSLELLASTRMNVTVCKSLSKCYGLSGMRAAYLVSHPSLIHSLRKFSPPWAVSHAAQIASVHALQDKEYYEDRIMETHALREELAKGLHGLGITVYPGVANFLLCELASPHFSAARLIADCRMKKCYIRDVRSMGSFRNDRFFRITVMSREDNKQLLALLAESLSSMGLNINRTHGM
jgi:histidinol-phosphate/aromatic aminotransferase/cobyric acid decarboxylase-like protein/N-acyl-L-homoserine lactone synthetase